MTIRTIHLIILGIYFIGSATAQTNGKGNPVPLTLSPILEMKAEAEDGHVAEASYRMPPGEGPFPAVICINGGLNFSNKARRHNTLTKSITHNRFLSMGFVVVQSTFRTYVENPQDQGPVSDNLAIIQAVRDLKTVDSDSIVVMGGSGGGSIAMDLISFGFNQFRV